MVIEGVPKLTMQSVWSFVYGLGLVFLVCLYTPSPSVTRIAGE